MEPSSTGAASVKLMLMFGVPAALASLLGMLIMPPHSRSEFVARIACTVVSSILFGPILAIALITWQPGVLQTAALLASQTGLGHQDLMSMFYVLGPCQLIAGLPAWWILGAYMRWMAKMREDGIPNWTQDFRRKIMGGDDAERAVHEVVDAFTEHHTKKENKDADS